MAAAENTTSHEAEHSSMPVGEIWKVFFILLGLTVLEFIIALAVPETIMSHPVKVIIYILLTLAKAYYIVAYFMHLKFEKLFMIYMIVIPTILILGIIATLLHEGDYWLLIR